jgi:YgiT-type zinc finger domain-containing protein
MKCSFCKGDLRPGKASYTETRNGCDVVFHDLPAFICIQCNEPLFDEKTVLAIQKVLSTMDENITPLREKAAA